MIRDIVGCRRRRGSTWRRWRCSICRRRGPCGEPRSASSSSRFRTCTGLCSQNPIYAWRRSEERAARIGINQEAFQRNLMMKNRLLFTPHLLGAERFTEQKDGGHLSGKHVIWIDLRSGSQEASIESFAGGWRHEPRHFRGRNQLTVDVTLQFTF